MSETPSRLEPQSRGEESAAAGGAARRWRLHVKDILIIAFVAAVFVILDARMHAFSGLDESVLNLARVSGMFSHPDLTAGRAMTSGDACAAPSAKYTVVLMPAPHGAAQKPTGPAPDPLWLQAVSAVRSHGPRVIALDLDVAASTVSASRVAEVLAPRASDQGRTSLAMIALPVPEDDPEASSRRRTRNQWFRELCSNTKQVPVAVASPYVHTSRLSNAVTQFHGERLDGRKRFAPPTYPALGQVAILLSERLDAVEPIAGPGMICSYLRDPSVERLPFVEEAHPKLLAEFSHPLFQAFRRQDQIFSVEWINPHEVGRDIPVLRVASSQDVASVTKGSDCFKDRIVFIGQEPLPDGRDSFSTLVSDSTPGVFVHAMTARSTETGMRSALALNAAVDLVVGYALSAITRRIPLPRLVASSSFSARLVGKLGRLLGIAVLFAAVLLMARHAIQLGLFLNPLVVLLGMWLHFFLSSFADGSRQTADDRALPRPLRWVARVLPAPEMAVSGPLRRVDYFVYGGSLCIAALVIGYAVFLVGLRISVRLE